MELHGLQGNLFNNIFFSESMPPPGTPVISRVSVAVNRQNSNLVEVKTRLARDAERIGANAVVNFKYGQKSHKWWQLVFTLKWDSEGWFGEGDAVRL